MRESLLEQLKNKKLSYIKEIERIIGLIQVNDYQMQTLNTIFKRTDYSLHYSNVYEALSELFETQEYCTFDEYDNIESKISLCKSQGYNLTLNSFLNYLELLANLFLLCPDKTNININQAGRIVANDIELIGFRLNKHGNYYRLILKDPETEAVASNLCQSTRDKIYDYLALRKGDVDEKRKVIKSLSDDIEVVCKTYNNVLEYSKTKQFIQCVRHTKDEPKKEFPFYYDDEEKWLDNSFKMIVGILSFTDTKRIVAEIIDLEMIANKK